MSKEGAPAKKRKIHMRDAEIQEYEKTFEGVAPLVKPQNVVKSSKDSNKGLYPRAPRKISAGALPKNNVSDPSRFGLEVGFQKASSALNPTLPFLPTTPKTSPVKLASSNSTPLTSTSTTTLCSRSPVKKATGKGSILHYFVPRSSPAKDQNTKSCVSNISQGSTQTEIESNKLATSATPKERLKPVSPSKRKRNRKEPTFNRDNVFLYSGIDNKPDPLSMGIQYSLLDSDTCSDTEAERTANFDALPLEILENIFACLPILDLCLTIPLVCKQWNDVIRNKSFVPFKKTYYKIKTAANLKECQEYSSILILMNSHGMTSPTNYLSGLVSYMAHHRTPRAEVTYSLRSHSRFSWARDVMNERLQHCIKDELLNPWSLVTLLCIVAENVSQVSKIIRCLQAGSAGLLISEVLECLYCIATFLLCFSRLKRDDVWNPMHYRLYYALYLFENESSYTSSQLNGVFKGTSGQQCLEKYSKNRELELTHEQMRIVTFEPQSGAFATIVAFAGTGKTTTLVRYTQLRPNKKFLLIVFNKSVQTHASVIFPSNVICQTGHSLAFRSVGFKYANKNQNKSRDVKPKFNAFGLKVGSVAQMIQPRKGISLFVQAKFVVDTISNYLCSADELVTTAHVPLTIQDRRGDNATIDHSMQMNIAKDAEDLWERMKDFNDREAPMTHDGYLKLFQLRKPRLTQYDMILVDEAQDLTPAVYDIICNQTQPKILVGDPNQQIYSFRGAINAMDLVQATHTFYLTQSFRFGPEIAFVANSALEIFKGERRRTLVGNANDSGILGDVKRQVAIISRTNYTLFSQAVSKCSFSDHDYKVAFVGGISGFGFPVILNIYTLMLPPETRKPHQEADLRKSFVGRFGTLAELEKYATQAQDNELLGKIHIVKVFNHTLPGHINNIKKRTVEIQSAADIIFSTAHKAKGLEFNTVKLTDDFEPSPPLRIPGSSQVSEAKDEANLLYVAVTRAKKRLVLTPTLIRLLDMAGENFLYPQHTAASEAEIAANGCQAPCLTCALTAAQFKPCALTIGRPAISLSDGAKQEAGVVSPQVITAECPSLKVLYGALQGARQNTDGIANSQSSSGHWKAYVGRAGYGLGAGNVLRAAGQQVANQIEEIDDAELAELVGF